MSKHMPRPLVVKPGRNGPTVWEDDEYAGSLRGELIADVWVSILDVGQEASGKRASMLVSSFNNTYAAGINPKAVPDLLKAAKAMLEHGGGINRTQLHTAIALAEGDGA